MNSIVPFLLILPPKTLLPIVFSTGILSPVSIASSIDVNPCVTAPSTGIFSPGLTIIVSPIFNISIAILFSLPLVSIIIAVFGCSPISFFIADEV